MTHQESDREELIRDATALLRRIELQLPGEEQPVVAGFRRQGEASIYFAQDPVFHFDKQGRLRRAFDSGDLYRTQGTTLARLRRVRSTDTTQLVRTDLTHAEAEEFLERMDERISRLQAAIAAGQANVVQRVPVEDEQILADLAAMLARIMNLDERLGPPFAGKH